MQISRRAMIIGGAAAAVSGPALSQRRPEGWFDRAIVVDALGGVSDPYAPPDHLRLSDRVWAEMLATGVTMLRDTVMPVGNIADPWAALQEDLEVKRDIIAANPDRLLPIRSATDILKAKRERKLGLLLGTQDSSMVGPALDRLGQLKKDGVMTVQLTYNNRNLAGDGALEPGNAGLSKLGKATIEQIEAEKLLLDLSHGGARTMAEAAAFAKRPLVVSHTGARALHDHPRNTDDATIRAVAGRGGVVGIYFMPFLAASMKPRAADVIAHIEHVARVTGEDHVGIGTDNGVLPIPLDEQTRVALRKGQAARIEAGIAAPGETLDFLPLVEDYNSVDRYRRLARDLARRGWSENRLGKLFGGNFLRVYRDAWGG
jgi:membrane dipeptidase